jgi:GGDEF domain-containing protein
MPSLTTRWLSGTTPGTADELATDLVAACRKALSDQTPLTFLALELTGVEAVRSIEGDPVADHLVATVASTLRRLSRRDRQLEAYRTGATEFAMLLRQTTVGEALTVAAAVRQRIISYAAPLDATLGLAAHHPRWCPDADGLREAATATLAQARRLGGDRVLAAVVSGGEWTWLEGPTAVV